MARTPAKNIQMACLSIGHYDYLLPVAKAIKIAELMQDAFNCERSYRERDYTYEVKPDQPQVSFALVRPHQVHISNADTPSSTMTQRRLR